MKAEWVGDIIECGELGDFVDSYNEQENKWLSDVLYEFMGKKVKVTIEIVDSTNSHYKASDKL